MKRGRPNVRGSMTTTILSILGSSKFPVTTSTICKTIEKDTQKRVSWNTVQKYLDELVAIGKVKPIDLPHSKSENKKGLTVYTIKND